MDSGDENLSSGEQPMSPDSNQQTETRTDENEIENNINASDRSGDEEDDVNNLKKRTLSIDSITEEQDEESSFGKRKKLKTFSSDEEDNEEDDVGKEPEEHSMDEDIKKTNENVFGSDNEDENEEENNVFRKSEKEDEVKEEKTHGDNDSEDDDVKGWEDDDRKDEGSDKERDLFGSDVDDVDDLDDVGSDEEEVNKASKEKERENKDIDEDEEDEDEIEDERKEEKERNNEDEDGADVQDEKIVHEIFGMSDEEDNFEGFNEEDDKSKKHKKIKKRVKSTETVSDGEEEGSDQEQPGFVSDFLQMMEKKKMTKKRRKKGDGDFVNDSDDVVDEMLNKMKQALQDDVESIKNKRTAYQVVKLLPYVKSMLLRIDLHQAMIDLGILSNITEWLAPLPDNSLPHLEVRETLIKQLIEFPSISTEGLKMSGLGKAIMYLFKHPKENRKNKEMCHVLINRWAKPIFNQGEDIRLTREEREQRDKDQVRRNSQSDAPKREAEVPLRPGDPGFVIRARVPQPSNMDYVNRPKWNVEERPSDGPSKKKLNKLQKYQRQFKQKKR